jgi:type VI secretion system secreted protein Hcp
MATDMALKLAGIEGESQKDGHENEIDVVAFEFGATQSGTAHDGGGSTAGRANVHDVVIVKYVDKASPLLFSHCVSGSHIKEAKLFVRKAGGKALDYLVITLGQVLVSSIEAGGNGEDDRVRETVRMNFKTITHEYTPQKEDGTGLGVVGTGYDVARGVEL